MSLFARQEEASATHARTGGGGRPSATVAEIVASATQAVASAAGGHGGSDGAATAGSKTGGKGAAAATSTAAAAAGGGKKNNAAKMAKIKAAQNGAYYTWWVTTGIVFGCFVVYAFTVLNAYRIRRKVAAARRAGAAPSTSRNGGGFWRGLTTWYQNTAYVLVVPNWLWTATTTAEWWWTIAYCGIVLGLGFYGCIANGVFDYANPIGYTAFAQIPLIVGLASRNSVLSWITGVSYEKLNYLHRAAGRICVLTTWLHTLGWFHKGLGKHGPGTKIFLSGMLGSVAVLVLWLTSFEIVRKRFYEFFLFMHITMSIIFIVASYYHWPRLGEWCWVGLVIWAFDRVAAALRMIVINKAWLLPISSRRDEHSGCVVELVEKDVVRLTVNRPLLKWSPGQHAFITMPGVATLRYEQHPMTIASIPDETGNVTFIIRAQTGFTRRLVNRLNSTKATDINCYIEGPYGLSHSLQHYDSVILLAGGTGVSYTLSNLLAIMDASRKQTTAVSHARMVWNVRDAAHVAWIAPLINAAVAKGTGSTRFLVDIYVTRSSAADEPGSNNAEKLESPADSPAESPSYSPSGSSENVTEKGSLHSPYEDKLAAAAGLSPAAASMFRWHRGRSHIEGILRTEVEESATDGAGVAIGVCGPHSLAIDARRAVCRVNAASAVLKGQNPVTLYTENFGW